MLRSDLSTERSLSPVHVVFLPQRVFHRQIALSLCLIISVQQERDWSRWLAPGTGMGATGFCKPWTRRRLGARSGYDFVADIIGLKRAKRLLDLMEKILSLSLYRRFLSNKFELLLCRLLGYLLISTCMWYVVDI